MAVSFILGLPGAGKTRFARAISSERELITFDDLRLQTYGQAYLAEREWEVYEIAKEKIYECLLFDRSVVIDESITTLENMQALVLEAKNQGALVVAYVVDTPEKECRANRVPFGFPKEDFDRKVQEWAEHKRDILALCDWVNIVMLKWI